VKEGIPVVPMILVGNKADLEASRQVPFKMGTFTPTPTPTPTPTHRV
jgi:hypothetical protein